MKVFTVVRKNSVLVQAVAESQDGETLGDLSIDLKEGMELFGLTYAQYQKLGSGEHEIVAAPVIVEEPDNEPS